MENYYFNGYLMTIFGSLNKFRELIDYIDVNVTIGSNHEFSH